MKWTLMVGMFCLMLPICGPAFELYDVHVGMSRDEVQATIPKQWMMKELGEGFGMYSVVDRRTGKTSDPRIYWFCRDYDQLAAVDNLLPFNKHFVPLSRKYIAEYGKPTNVSVTVDETILDEKERISLEWTQGQETLSISASIPKDSKRGREVPIAVIALKGLTKCHADYWERKDRPSTRQSPFRSNSG